MCTYHALGAMKERLLHSYDKCELRHPSTDRHTLAQTCITHNQRLAAHAQGFALSGDQKDQPDTRFLQYVAKRVGTSIAGAFWHGKRLVIQHTHKAGRVALRRYIDVAGSVGRSHQHEWGAGDEAFAMNVEGIDDLRRDPFVRSPENSFQRFE